MAYSVLLVRRGYQRIGSFFFFHQSDKSSARIRDPEEKNFRKYFSFHWFLFLRTPTINVVWSTKMTQRKGKNFVCSTTTLNEKRAKPFRWLICFCLLKSNCEGVFDETTNSIELCATQVKLSPDGEKFTSWTQPHSTTTRLSVRRASRIIRDRTWWKFMK